jgi:SAM-dependent methyltransferase
MFSEACERNKTPIGDALATFIGAGSGIKKALEFGSGTGQHAEYFLQRFDNLCWQPSDVAENIDQLTQRLVALPGEKCLAPIVIDFNNPVLIQGGFDVVFTANTLHIVSDALVERLILQAAEALNNNGLFFVYGPFNYQGNFSSQSNAKFDQWLKQRDKRSGIRDIEKIITLSKRENLILIKDIVMPANNQLLVFKKR